MHEVYEEESSQGGSIMDSDIRCTLCGDYNYTMFDENDGYWHFECPSCGDSFVDVLEGERL